MKKSQIRNKRMTEQWCYLFFSFSGSFVQDLALSFEKSRVYWRPLMGVTDHHRSIQRHLVLGRCEMFICLNVHLSFIPTRKVFYLPNVIACMLSLNFWTSTVNYFAEFLKVSMNWLIRVIKEIPIWTHCNFSLTFQKYQKWAIGEKN